MTAAAYKSARGIIENNEDEAISAFDDPFRHRCPYMEVDPVPHSKIPAVPAQAVANELGVPVPAPTSKVGTSPQLGLNQTLTIGNNGYWRTYPPMAH